MEPANSQPETITICGWCPDSREKTLAAIKEGKNVTHGICPTCEKKFDDQATKRYGTLATS